MTRSSLKIKHVFWDWNGTLLDDAELCASIINGILVKHGLGEISYKQYRSSFDFPVRRYYERLGLSSKGVSFEETSAQFIENYERRWEICKLQPRALSTVRQIKALGIPQSIITAGKESSLHGFVRHHRLSGYFSGLVGVDHIYASGKVDRAKDYAKSLDLGGAEVLMVGDTVHDHEVGSAIGATVLLYSEGHHPKERLAELGSTVITCLSEVLEHL